MLTQAQITYFRLATAANNNGGYEEDADLDDACCRDDQVAQTRDTIADFVTKCGQPHETDNYSFGNLLVWNGLQTRKGATRGNLYVMDFGEARGTYFSGQA
jgi:hypothetical protein